MAPRKTHVQTTLLPPEVVEAVLRVGVVGAAGHLQCQVEVHDPSTGELLALWSLPHALLPDLEASVTRSAGELVQMLRELVGPF